MEKRDQAMLGDPGFRQERGKGVVGIEGMPLGLAPFHVPSMAVLLDPPGGGEGGCLWRGLGWGLSSSLLSDSLQVFLKEAAGNHPRSSGVSQRLHWGSQHRSQGTQWSRCSQRPSCPYPLGSGSPALSMYTPCSPPSTRGEG